MRVARSACAARHQLRKACDNVVVLVCADVRCCYSCRCRIAQGPGTPTAMTPSAEDTPFGFGSTPTVTGSVAAFKRRCEWFYVDPNGEEHGPVAFQKLMSWYKKGHFPEDVKVG